MDGRILGEEPALSSNYEEQEFIEPIFFDDNEPKIPHTTSPRLSACLREIEGAVVTGDLPLIILVGNAAVEAAEALTELQIGRACPRRSLGQSKVSFFELKGVNWVCLPKTLTLHRQVVKKLLYVYHPSKGALIEEAALPVEPGVPLRGLAAALVYESEIRGHPVQVIFTKQPTFFLPYMSKMADKDCASFDIAAAESRISTTAAHDIIDDEVLRRLYV